MADFQSKVGQVQTDRPRATGRPRDLGRAELMAGEAAVSGIKSAFDITKEVVTGKLEGETEAEWNVFIESKNLLNANRRALTNAEEELGQTLSGGDKEAIRESVDTYTKLRRMVVLGKLSPAEAKLRSEDTLRRHVNESPLFREQLISARDQILGMHKDQISVIIERESFLAKQEKADRAQNDKIVDMSRAIMLNKGEVPLADDQAVVIRAAEIKKMEDDRQAVVDGRVDTAFSQTELLTTGGMGDGNISDLNGKLLGAFEDYRGKESRFNTPEEFNVHVESVLRDNEQFINANFGQAENDDITRHMLQLRNIADTYIDGIKNDLSKEQMANNLSIVQDSSVLNAMNNSTMKAMFVLGKISSGMTLPANVLQFGEGATGYKNIMKYLSSVSNSNNIVKTTPGGNAIVTQSGLVLEQGMVQYKDMDVEERKGFDTILTNVSGVLSGGESYTQENADLVVNFASNKATLDRVKNDPSFTATANNIDKGLTSYAQDALIPHMMKDFREDLETSMRSASGPKPEGDLKLTKLFQFVEAHVSPSGVISFRIANLDTIKSFSGDPSRVKGVVTNAVDSLNDKYSSRFNSLATAMSYIKGTEDKSDAMFSIFAGRNVEGLPKFTGAITTKEEPVAPAPVVPEVPEVTGEVEVITAPTNLDFAEMVADPRYKALSKLSPRVAATIKQGLGDGSLTLDDIEMVNDEN